MSEAPLRLPAFVNAHSHAFQRGLRGRVERAEPGRDDFWSWRERMYELAVALDPDSLYALTLAAYREMRAAGYGAVGEFHYPHHRPDGSPYPDANAMAHAVQAAARDAGLELVLLLCAYARAGPGRAAEPRQRRFCDADPAAYLRRLESLAGDGRVGLAPHSVRALPREWLQELGAYAEASGLPVHVHADEQPREVEECLAEHGRRPVELLADCGLLGPRTTVVHATHASDGELDLIASAGAGVCACPTTEGNLGDGFLPALALLERGIPICIGSDSNVRIDPLEELREIETCARRQARRRNVLVPAGADGPTDYLLEAGTVNGARALGIEPSAAGEVEVALEHPQLADVARADLPAALVFGACAGALRPLA